VRRPRPAGLIVVIAIVAVVVARAVTTPEDGGGEKRGRVAAVVDGDTIKVATSSGGVIRVRLLGIDTPETHRPDTPVECGGPEATAAMTRVAGRGTSVRLETDPTQDRFDRYGRLLAYVRLDDGRLVQDELLRSGWADVYVYRGRPAERIAAFRRDLASARVAGRGVWGRCGGDFHSSGRL
jgi:micrococcal nuclease